MSFFQFSHCRSARGRASSSSSRKHSRLRSSLHTRITTTLASGGRAGPLSPRSKHRLVRAFSFFLFFALCALALFLKGHHKSRKRSSSQIGHSSQQDGSPPSPLIYDLLSLLIFRFAAFFRFFFRLRLRRLRPPPPLFFCERDSSPPQAPASYSKKVFPNNASRKTENSSDFFFFYQRVTFLIRGASSSYLAS